MSDESLEEAVCNSLGVTEELKSKLPVFHSRQMKREFVNKFERVSSAVKPSVLRYFYQNSTGDSSTSETTNQKELDSRNIVTNLRPSLLAGKVNMTPFGMSATNSSKHLLA